MTRDAPSAGEAVNSASVLQRLYVMAGLVAGAYVLYRLSAVLTPFLIAGILAYLGNPLVSRLQRWGLPRSAGTTLVFVLVVLLVAGVVTALLPAIRHQALLFLDYTRQYAELLQRQIIPELSARLGIHLDSQTVTHYASANAQKLADWLGKSLRIAVSSGSGILATLLDIVLIPVLGFYLLRDWPGLLERIRELIPRRRLPLVELLARDANAMLMAFLRGQILVMLALGTSYAIGLSIVGLQTAILIGLLAGFLSFVPYLGVISGISMATLAMYVQTGAFLPIVGVWVVFGIGQILESMVYTPYLVGERIGLHPVLVIFAVLAGGELFGFAGLLLALPVTAVLIALLRHAQRWYLDSPWYRGSAQATEEAQSCPEKK
ncbi:AI-2E family transporter [Acidithiobacillus sp.]|uniref:AI-2E family transporter n=1 Tax=Acidithiobacillus sp. TaxID=1872118 RepID=UPI0025C17E3E|nr:AI-2E family transporter [Acidithiobacillus sp.]